MNNELWRCSRCGEGFAYARAGRTVAGRAGGEERWLCNVCVELERIENDLLVPEPSWLALWWWRLNLHYRVWLYFRCVWWQVRQFNARHNPWVQNAELQQSVTYMVGMMSHASCTCGCRLGDGYSVCDRCDLLTCFNCQMNLKDVLWCESCVKLAGLVLGHDVDAEYAEGSYALHVLEMDTEAFLADVERVCSGSSALVGAHDSEE
jgi:hypothetical protein